MSDVFKSSFSYHVAVGKTTSAYKQVVDMRKSSTTNKSNLPSTAGRTVISFGVMQCASSPNTAFCVPNKYFRKYSCPLPDEPKMFERQTNILRGKFFGLSGSLHDMSMLPFFKPSTVNCTGSTPASAAMRVISMGLVLNCGAEGNQPMRSALAL